MALWYCMTIVLVHGVDLEITMVQRSVVLDNHGSHPWYWIWDYHGTCVHGIGITTIFSQGIDWILLRIFWHIFLWVLCVSWLIVGVSVSLEWVCVTILYIVNYTFLVEFSVCILDFIIQIREVVGLLMLSNFESPIWNILKRGSNGGGGCIETSCL